MIIVGTSGWQYRDRRDRFYPAGVAQRYWLSFYAERFATVQINSSFYRLPLRETFARWREQTPDDFRASVKMSRYLTHLRRLRAPAGPVARFPARADGLGRKLRPVWRTADFAAASRRRGAPVTRAPSTREGRGVRPR